MFKCLNAKIKEGFSVIEMLVAVTILTLVIGAATGLFVSAVRSQAKALASQKLFDETSYTIEYIGRYLRMAKKDDLDGVNCLSGNRVNYELTAQGIKFRNYQDTCQEFYLSSNILYENKGGTVLPLTSDNLQITSLKFNISGEAQPPANYFQPRVTI